jgi:glutaredoxin-like protein
MPLLAPGDQARLQTDFAALANRVSLVFFTQTFGCETCDQARQIVQELAALSDKVTIEEVNFVLEPERAAPYGVDRVPAVVVLALDGEGNRHDPGLRFLGVPAGYEFISLVHAVMLAGGQPSSLSAGSLSRVAAVDRPTTIRVFTTPTCPHCPRAVNMAQEMAAANPHITSVAIEATEFPDLVRRYAVSGVPKTVVDDRVEILGALPEEDFVEQALGN